MYYPKISIVTPTLNQDKYIEQTILSVLEQKYPNLEYIIIDGGSTDETIKIIKKYQQHLSYWISETDNGQTDAINKGFAKCTGEIFNWINSDDYYEPGALKKIGELFTNNPLSNVVCGKEWSFIDGNPTRRTLSQGSLIKGNVFETIQIGIIDQPCTFFRRESIAAFFPLNDSLRYVMDRELWWSFLLKYGQDDILVTDDILSNFRVHPQSKSFAEADLFEMEFDRLKLTLFRQLRAPIILENQLPENTKPIPIKWTIDIKPVQHIAAEFATWFAERNYVNDNIKKTGQLMRLVKKWKKVNMNKKEWKLWVAGTIIPEVVVKALKKIKTSI